MPGTQGPPGLSAYEVAVHDGFVGTEAQWLASLKGATGATGATGAQGVQGPAGPQGPTGATGATGARGANGTNGATGATGATGPRGVQGPAGPTGATGATGAVGARGPQGVPGASGTGGSGSITVNGHTGSTIVLTATDVGADAAGAAAAVTTASASTYTRKDANLTDLVSASAARTALGLGGAAVLSVGTAAGTVAAGNDSRLSDARVPSGSASGDLSGTYPSPTVGKLQNVSLGGTAAVGKTLTGTDDTHAAWVQSQGAGSWIFNVQSYGAVGDGKAATDGAMTSGSPVLTCATSTPFTSADVGKAIQVKGAAPTGVTTLVTTIAGFTDSGHVTLTASAATTVTNAVVLWGTDDTQAFTQAVSDANTYGAAHGVAKVFVPAATGRFYAIAGPLITGGSTLGNAQIPVAPLASTGGKCVLTIEGVTNGSALQHWEQTLPQLGGSTLVSFGVFASTSAQTTSINAGGNPCVIGGPAQAHGYGASPGTFSNHLLTIRNLSILTTHSAYGLTYTAVDMSGMANGHVENFAYGTTGVVPTGDFASASTLGTGLSIGLLMPAAGNNDNCIMRNITCHGGYTYAVFATEHAVVDTMRLLYCWAAFCAVGSYYGSVGATHAISAQQLSVEACVNVLYIIGVGSSGIGPFINIDQLDTETSTPTIADNNAGVGLAAALGTVRLTGLYTQANVAVAHPTGLKIIDGQRAQPLHAITADYTALVTDEKLLVNATAGNVAVTLPSALNTALSFVIKKTDSSANTVTVVPAGGQTIDGASTLVLGSQWMSVSLVPSGGNWYVV